MQKKILKDQDHAWQANSLPSIVRTACCLHKNTKISWKNTSGCHPFYKMEDRIFFNRTIFESWYDLDSICLDYKLFRAKSAFYVMFLHNQGQIYKEVSM